MPPGKPLYFLINDRIRIIYNLCFVLILQTLYENFLQKIFIFQFKTQFFTAFQLLEAISELNIGVLQNVSSAALFPLCFIGMFLFMPSLLCLQNLVIKNSSLLGIMCINGMEELT